MIPVFEKGKTCGDKRVPQGSFLELFPVEAEGVHPFVLVFPGGGYNHLASHEGADIAEWFNQRGIHAGVFYYQLDPVDIDLLLEQVQEILADLQKNPAYGPIGIIGFSAGGHLAALCSTKNTRKPDFNILSYPVISLFEPHVHEGSREQILPNGKEEEWYAYSPEHLVSKETPTTFLWHTAEDQAVPVENVLLYASQLSAHQVPYELHIFQTGRHGLGLAEEERFTKDWTQQLERWLQKNGVIS
ncbi:alpha/beta hydrolase [Jeotgalibaca caeni]|uniref:alpha/beta hydrolase n=1 Tax=Jeotgalibaca caeni TaxID=3028623 RepID=UPI00237ECF11|nr:alpha/beta hydrolase [Jeotgalibaca caeni]MDE1549436.1 alpha/beta hydrolase [Jeotgalibaca caeni]